jgi:hypothetical protein
LEGHAARHRGDRRGSWASGFFTASKRGPKGRRRGSAAPSRRSDICNRRSPFATASFSSKPNPCSNSPFVTRETQGRARDGARMARQQKAHSAFAAPTSVRAGFDLTQPFAVTVEGRKIETESASAEDSERRFKGHRSLVFENGLWNKIGAAELETELPRTASASPAESFRCQPAKGGARNVHRPRARQVCARVPR